MALRSIEILADDGKTNLSAEVWSAFGSTGVTEAVEAAGGEDDRTFASQSLPGKAAEETVVPDEQAEPATGRRLKAAHVEQMLDCTAEWKLAVPVGDEIQVLEKAALKATFGRTGKLLLRSANYDERRLLAAATAKTPVERLTDARAFPATLFAALTGIAAAFAEAENARTDWLVWVAVGLAAAAFLISAFSTVNLRAEAVRQSRLDLLEARHDRMVRRDVSRWQVPGALTLLAIPAFVLAFLVGGDPAASASLKLGGTSVQDTGREAEVLVKWSDLPEGVTEVRTTVTGGATADATQPVTDETAEQKLELELARPGQIDVTTRAYKGDNPVGAGYIRTFDVE